MRYSAILAVVVFAAMVGFGCQSSTPSMSPAMTSPQRAVVVSGGNSGSSFTVFLPSGDAANPTMLCASGQAECPECKAAAAKYFQTGVLDPKCSRTGATRSVVTGLPPNQGHS
jgi:hypothetical protein